MPVLPPLIAWALGALGAAIVAKLAHREWQRVNAELDRPVPVSDPERTRMPTLQRDSSGVYRPNP